MGTGDTAEQLMDQGAAGHRWVVGARLSASGSCWMSSWDLQTLIHSISRLGDF